MARRLRIAGARHVSILHTYDREVADSETFVEPLLHARGVLFGGGRQWRLAEVYLNTRTHRALAAVLERGGVIAGASAGAVMLGSFLVRGDTAGNNVMIGDHQAGFGFLRGVAIDVHILARNRHFDMLQVTEAHPQLLGLGLDEGAAVVVKQDRFDVIGDSYVAVYDTSRKIASNGSFYFLAAGDRYDLAKREPHRATPTLATTGEITRPTPGPSVTTP